MILACLAHTEGVHVLVAKGRCAVSQEPLEVRNVGKSVTAPAWTLGDIMWVACTMGMAWPWIWARRRKRTTVTRHR